ncbi:MAG: hypothetical protein QW767_06660 [Thermoprotei archaeon]
MPVAGGSHVNMKKLALLLVFTTLATLTLTATASPQYTVNAQTLTQPTVTQIALYSNPECAPPPVEPQTVFGSNATTKVYFGLTTDVAGQTVDVKVVNPAGVTVAYAQASETPSAYFVCTSATVASQSQPLAGTWKIEAYVTDNGTGQPQTTGYTLQTFFNPGHPVGSGPEFPAGSWVALLLVLPVYLLVRRRVQVSTRAASGAGSAAL